MKVKDIIKLYEGLVKLGEANLKLPAKTSYGLAKNKVVLEPLYQAANEARQSIWIKYGEPTLEGGLQIPNEKIGNANQEMIELFETENEVRIHKIKLEDFGDVPIDFSLIENIMDIIEEE